MTEEGFIEKGNSFPLIVVVAAGFVMPESNKIMICPRSRYHCCGGADFLQRNRSIHS